jgi:hypothetical protein
MVCVATFSFKLNFKSNLGKKSSKSLHLPILVGTLLGTDSRKKLEKQMPIRSFKTVKYVLIIVGRLIGVYIGLCYVG